jgi:hypothetical protein
MTCVEVRQRMTAEERLRWGVLEELDPWGQARDDWRIAYLTASIANAVGWQRKDGRAWMAQDFLLQFALQPAKTVPQLPRRQKTTEELTGWIELMIVGANKAFAERGIVPRAS